MLSFGKTGTERITLTRGVWPISMEIVLTLVAPISLVTAEFGLVLRTVDLSRGNQRSKLGKDDIYK